MIWLVGFSICVLLLLGDIVVAAPEPDEIRTLSRIVLAALVPASFACIQSRLVTLGWQNLRRRQSWANGILRGMLVSNYLVWFVSSATIMLFLDWPRLVRDSWSLGNIPLIDEIVILIPVIASLVVSGVVINNSLHATGTSRFTMLPTTRSDYVLAAGQLRTFGGLVCLPVMILFLLRDLTNLFLPQAYTGLALGLGGALFLILMICFYPVIIATTWKTTPLTDDSLKTELRQITTELGMRPISVRVWHTHGMIVNAVVVGLLPGTRTVFLTDGLLAHFDNRQVMSIFRHELGHIAGGHLWIRLFVLVCPLLLATMALVCMPDYQRFTEWVDGISFMVGPGLIALVCLSWMLTAPVFRHCEYSADRFAIQDAFGRPNPQLAADYYSALVKLAMINPQSSTGRSMIHPSIRSRIQAVAVYTGNETWPISKKSGATEN